MLLIQYALRYDFGNTASSYASTKFNIKICVLYKTDCLIRKVVLFV